MGVDFWVLKNWRRRTDDELADLYQASRSKYDNGTGTDRATRDNRRHSRIGHFLYTPNEGNLFWFFIKPKLMIGSIRVEEQPNEEGTEIRKYLKVIVRNEGKSVAKDCEATVTLIPERSTAHLLPSPYEKVIVWDNKQRLRRIFAHSKAVLYIAFTQDNFLPSQWNPETKIPNEEKIHGKIATFESFMNGNVRPISYPEDVLSIGDTYLSLHVQTEDGYYADAIFCVSIAEGDWRGISIRQVC